MYITGKSGQLENIGFGKIPQWARKLITKIKEKIQIFLTHQNQLRI
jgi:hypothetical protein